MKRHLVTAFLYTIVTAIGLGVFYPLFVAGISHLLFRNNANGQLIVRGEDVIGSRLIGQPFTGPGLFHSRPSAAGTGYDASSSSGSNLAPTSKALIDRINASVKTEGQGTPVPIDLVTASGSGLDPDITPAAALYQVERISRERNIPEGDLRKLVLDHVKQRQFGLLGEPRVNVLELNLALNKIDDKK
ncbi:potassium-transporting ATPase subunit KdpC [Edaphobacter albus]|uniref:potassium-transporting ATPase subunit KdpC n=1 Tax=Edaphobacter sp. 4G125 TaxID=2763071 RepID=UPI00164835BE|nr:potassium-transporting ATPase subunit KdpC [Edaphobacter sp. 4G125]QNI36441.1 potassium-transporting ATPase subunit KdpC [Edaphobacter sp. 4G125]